MLASGVQGMLVSIAGTATAISSGAVAAGPVYFTDGNAAAPGISFAGDHTTGFFRGAGSLIGISIGGVSLLLGVSGSTFNIIDSGGNDGSLTYKAQNFDLTTSITTGLRETAWVFHNTSAVASVTVTLTAAVTTTVGTFYTFVQNNAANTFVIKPGASDTIRLNDVSVTSAGGALTYTTGKGKSVRVECLAPNQWQVTSVVGTAPVAT